MAPPELPIEVQERVVDQLHDDRETLKSCNMVCRTWSWTARSHYWRTVKLNNRRDCIRLLSVLEESQRLGTGAGNFVRILQLPSMGFSTQIPTRAIMRCELLRSVMRHLPMVELLHVNGFSISSLLFHLYCREETSNMQDAISSIFDFRHLKVVYCDSLDLFGIGYLPQFIGAFPSVSRIRLRKVTSEGFSPMFNVASIQDFLASRRKGLICIQELTMTNCIIPIEQLSELLETLAAPPFELQLKRLGWMTIKRDGKDFLPLLEMMFYGAKATLEFFQCTLDAGDRWLEHLDPSEHLRLQSLTLAFRFSRDQPSRWDHIASFLSKITSTSLHTLAIHLHFHDQLFVQEFLDWPALIEAVLSLHRKCPSMSLGFRVYYYGKGTMPEVHAPLWTRIAPILAARIPVGFYQQKAILQIRT